MRDSLACLSPMIINLVFSGLTFKFHTIHPLLNTGETLGELSKTGIKVPMVKC